ncbi:hypothetical protein CIPAW_11G071300 [Carya illinoinensis]|uniref:Uncharacterized protein n=1 Tax=Carya illinoinensis TaxID=32201 RepID=A0A8T1NUK9_CARIL|nr:hypothetical protein CIPAW_11G071300 [Carya illinoinensis]KAG6687663.1 hypothetical protein I3842_11G084200 [Carya illinoinensis]
MDLRYLVPPFISLYLLLSQDKPSPQDHVNLESGILYHHPFSLFFLAIFTFLFLFISVNLPITLEPIQLRGGGFSVVLTVSIVASIIFPASLFWLIFLMLIIASPLLDGFKSCICWFYNTLRQIPTLFIHCTIQHPGEPEAAPLQAELELAEIV